MEQRGGLGGWMTGQLALLAASALILGWWPARGGELLLVPLAPAPAAQAVRIALDAQARLIGPGPLPGSYVVRGDRDRLARALLPAGILVLSGTAAGCGEPDPAA
jgi:hypothetical protein